MAAPNAPVHDLTLAQVLRDLGDLFVAEPDAALALITANKNPSLSSRKISKASLASPADSPQSDRRAPSGSGTRARKSLAPRESLSRQKSVEWTAGDSGFEGNEDMERAKTLLALWEVRNRGGFQENMSLERARASVESVERKYRRLNEGAKWDGRGGKGTAG